MQHEYLLWLLPLMYVGHILEEYTLNWRDWSRQISGIEVDWAYFYLVNAAVLVMGMVTAMIGWRAPMISLAMPAQMLINAVFFHILPTLRWRVFAPGTLTAVILFLPTALVVYAGAAADGVLTITVLAGSGIFGVIVMALPIVLLFLGPYLRYKER
jgi:hypothetical protein